METEGPMREFPLPFGDHVRNGCFFVVYGHYDYEFVALVNGGCIHIFGTLRVDIGCLSLPTNVMMSLKNAIKSRILGICEPIQVYSARLYGAALVRFRACIKSLS